MTRISGQSAQPDLQSLAPVKPGELLADKYRIGAVLGMGGMGVVVQARDELLDRDVAIKFLLPRLSWSESSLQRFMREARASTRISSEHVVKLLEIGKLASGAPFLVMERLLGQDLKSLLAARGALPAEEAVDYVMQALQAVGEGHVRGVVHRDLKPGNLFLTRRADGSALLKVLDFGIAKTLHSEQAEQSSAITNTDDVLLGSPSYMSPEQLANPRDVDERSDIWSLGVTLFELLSGRLPFDGDSKFAIMTSIMKAEAPELRSPAGSPEVPQVLVEVVLRCLCKDRQARFASAGELAAALAPFGSEDARVSLRRIVGVGSTPSATLTSTPPHGVESVRATSTTLPALAGADNERAPQPSQSGMRSKLAIAATLVLVCAVFAISQLPLRDPDPLQARDKPRDARAAGVHPLLATPKSAAAALPLLATPKSAAAALPLLATPKSAAAGDSGEPRSQELGARPESHDDEHVSRAPAPVSRALSSAAPLQRKGAETALRTASLRGSAEPATAVPSSSPPQKVAPASLADRPLERPVVAPPQLHDIESLIQERH
jgi:serine/threonine-protein kinase